MNPKIFPNSASYEEVAFSGQSAATMNDEVVVGAQDNNCLK